MGVIACGGLDYLGAVLGLAPPPVEVSAPDLLGLVPP
jgi:hypothetical protein